MLGGYLSKPLLLFREHEEVKPIRANTHYAVVAARREHDFIERRGCCLYLGVHSVGPVKTSPPRGRSQWGPCPEVDEDLGLVIEATAAV